MVLAPPHVGAMGPSMRQTRLLRFESSLAASAEEVWAVFGSMNGVSAERNPRLRMTAPPEASDLCIEDAPIGSPMFACWVLLGGIVPIDRHHFMLAEVEPGRGFVEDSTSWTERRWQHRRRVEPSGDHA